MIKLIGIVSILSICVFATDYSEFWSEPEAISNCDSICFRPEFFLINENLGIASWLTYDASNYCIKGCFKTSSGWELPREIFKSKAKISSLKVCLNENNFGLIVWKTFERCNTEIWALAYNGVWQSPTNLANCPSHVKEISTSINANGEAIVAWTEFDPISFSYSIKCTEYIDHFWRPTTIVAEHCNRTNKIFAHLSDQNEGALIWNESKKMIYASRTNGSWDSMKTIPTSDYEVHSFDAAFSKKADFGLAVWQAVGSKKKPVIGSTLFKNGNWMKSSVISEDNSFCYQPILGCNDSANAIVAWQKRADDQFTIQSRFYGPNGWEKTQDVSDNRIFRKGVSLKVNNLNQAQLVWSFEKESTFWIKSAFFDCNKWSSPKKISSNHTGSCSPKISIDDSGKAGCLWLTTGKERGTSIEFSEKNNPSF